MNIQASVKFDKQFWNRIGVWAVREIRVRTQKGKDRNEKRFPAYDPDYAELKRRGFTRLTKRTGAKGTKYKAYSGISLERQTSPPNFMLTRKTMNDLRIRLVTDQFVDIGWGGEAGGVVDAHEERGKYKVAGFSDKEQNRIVKMVGDEVERNWNTHVKNVIINVGKK
ncbi:MAG TPA: hypothetical protein VIH28_09660 [Ignavibacteriaceae bacterium]